MTLDASERLARRAGLVAALVALAGGLLTLNHMLVGVFYDDGNYASIAYALSHGLGYVHPNLPGHPAAIHFPPVYPLILAPLFGTLSLGGAAFAAKLLNVLLSAATAGLVAWHATRTELLGPRAPAWLACAVVSAAAVALPTLTTLSVLFSEPLFGLFLAAAVVMADRPPERWSAERGALLAGCAAALALLTRTIGIAAGAGIVCYLLLVRRLSWRGATLAGVPVAVAALGWGLWVLRQHAGIDPGMAINYGSYFEVLRGAGLGVTWSALRELPRPLGDLTLRWLPGAALYYPFAAAALATLLCGLFLLCRRSSIGFTLLGYLAILAVWPFPVDRFVWVVLPWLGLAWGAGLVRLLEPPRPLALRIAAAVVAGAVIIGYSQLEIRSLLGGWWRAGPQWVSISASEMLPWFRALPEDAVIAADFEPLFWINTGRTSVPFYVYGYDGRHVTSPTPAEHRAYLERQGVTHVMVSGAVSQSAPELNALLAAYPGWLTEVQRWSGGRVAYRVNGAR